jgi:hypothetical protein
MQASPARQEARLKALAIWFAAHPAVSLFDRVKDPSEKLNPEVFNQLRARRDNRAVHLLE